MVSPELKELTLIADDWTSGEVVGCTDNLDPIAESDSVWLVAETTEGKERRWLLHPKSSTNREERKPMDLERFIAETLRKIVMGVKAAQQHED